MTSERMERAWLRTAYRPLETCLATIAASKQKVPHQPFDLNPKKVISAWLSYLRSNQSTTAIAGHCRYQDGFLGQFSGYTSWHKDKIENPGLLQEHFKNEKHTAFYSPIGFAFPSFVVSCFGTLGPTAVRCLYSLADLELRQHEAFLSRQNLAPIDPSARSQFRAISYRQISARIGLAVAKASVMRLLSIARLPSPSFVPRSLLARNCPGLADSVSQPCFSISWCIKSFLKKRYF
jgi:hypothetical protein